MMKIKRKLNKFFHILIYCYCYCYIRWWMWIMEKGFYAALCCTLTTKIIHASIKLITLPSTLDFLQVFHSSTNRDDYEKQMNHKHIVKIFKLPNIKFYIDEGRVCGYSSVSCAENKSYQIWKFTTKMHHELMIISNMKFMWHFTCHAVNSSSWYVAPNILIVAVKMVTDFWYLFGFICDLPHSITIIILVRNIHAVNILILRKISSTAATSSSSLYASQKFMWFLHHLFMNK